MWHDPSSTDYVEPVFSEYLELDLSTVVPSIAGPKRPQDRIALTDAKESFAGLAAGLRRRPRGGGVGGADEAVEETFPASDPIAAGEHADVSGRPTHASGAPVAAPAQAGPVHHGRRHATELDHGQVVIASITSCTNTSNPSVMLAAGLLAKNAVENGLAPSRGSRRRRRPGSKVVTDYYEKAGLWPYLEKLGFHLVGYGCTTCIGNSGPLPDEVSAAVNDERPGRGLGALRQPQLRGPDQPRREDELPGVPAAGHRLRAGRHDGLRLRERAAGHRPRRQRRVPEGHLAGRGRGAEHHRRVDRPRRCSPTTTPTCSHGDERWQSLPTPEGDTFEWDAESTYVRKPPYFEGMSREPDPVTDIAGARVLAKLGDSVTTDHISPGGRDQVRQPGRPVPDRARGRAQGLQLLRLAPRQPRGDDPRHVRQHPAAQPAGARRRGRHDRRPPRPASRRRSTTPRWPTPRPGVPLVVLGGKEYGSGSSRDWAAKGTSPAGRQGRHRGELRADPPLEPHRHGRAAAAVPGRRVRRLARPGRHGDLRRSPG